MKPYICEFSSSLSPQCQMGWTYVASTDCCYMALNSSGTWGLMSTKCRDAGGDLVSIHSTFENSITSAIAYNAGITQAWIGIVVGNQNDNSTWTWSDGSKLNYTNWGTSVNGENVTGYIDSIDNFLQAQWNISAPGESRQCVCKTASFT
uniref:C-type lectin domain-containing protein n=1 Tax=Acrobeloides nanus TaxID=290746 RepID=A0A914DVB5_9BILA